MQISAVIITLNEEKKIEQCIRSLKNIADEILVFDSFSTDNTVSIAKQLGAKVLQHKFEGYMQQKELATNAAQYDWIFSIDADEVVTERLEKSILQIKNGQFEYSAYQVSRITNYCGKWIKHCGWYPDKVTRLIDRTKGSWGGGSVHEHWVQNTTTPTGLLKGDLLHYSYDTISQHIIKIDKFTELGARDAVAKGKDCSKLKVWLAPKWYFFTAYILQLGILDGYYGYIICKYSSFGKMIKYGKIRQYAKMKREGIPY